MKATFRVVYWNVLVLGAGLLIIELIFGTWVSGDPVDLIRTINGTWHYQAIAGEIKAEDHDVIYHRDRWGLRGSFDRPWEVDILTIGGSTTDQKYITEGATWQDVLQMRFAQNGKQVGVANAGMIGRTTFGHIKDFDLWFPLIDRLKPRYVLFYLGVNDMFFDQPNTDSDRLIARGRNLSSRVEQFKQWVRDNSAAYYVYRTLRGMFQAHAHDLSWSSLDFHNAVWTQDPARNDYRIVLKPRLAQFRERLHLLVDRVSKWGATPIFVAQPRGDFVYKDGGVWGMVKTQSRMTKIHDDKLLGTLTPDSGNGVDYYLMLRLFNDVSMDVCSERGGICIDLMRDLEFSVGDFYDHVHNTVQGSRKIGEFLFARLNSRIVAD